MASFSSSLSSLSLAALVGETVMTPSGQANVIYLAVNESSPGSLLLQLCELLATTPLQVDVQHIHYQHCTLLTTLKNRITIPQSLDSISQMFLDNMTFPRRVSKWLKKSYSLNCSKQRAIGLRTPTTKQTEEVVKVQCASLGSKCDEAAAFLKARMHLK